MLLRLTAIATLAACALASQLVLDEHTPKPTHEGYTLFPVKDAGKPTFTHYQVFGDLANAKARPLVVLHGGPGVPSNYLLSLTDLSRHMPVVLYDQLGSGRSTHLREKLGDTGFWTEQLFVDELFHLVEHLGIADNYAVLGHSWGGMLGSRFASLQPKGLKKLVISSSPASMKLWLEAANSLRKKLPQDVQDTLDKHEQDGTTDSEEYLEAVAVFYANYVCRINPMPKDVQDAFEMLDEDNTVYLTMNGPSEFNVVGPLKDWTMIDDAHKIKVPMLVTNGKYDEAQNSVVEPWLRLIPNVQWHHFKNSSHMSHWEQRDEFMDVVGKFLLEK